MNVNAHNQDNLIHLYNHEDKHTGMENPNEQLHHSPQDLFTHVSGSGSSAEVAKLVKNGRQFDLKCGLIGYDEYQ